MRRSRRKCGLTTFDTLVETPIVAKPIAEIDAEEFAFSKWLNSNALMDDFLSEAEEHKADMARQSARLLKKQPASKPVPARAKTSNKRCRVAALITKENSTHC
jgi:hypothetical protein